MKKIGYMMLGMAITGAGLGTYMYLGNNKGKKFKMKNMYSLTNNSNNN